MTVAALLVFAAACATGRQHWTVPSRISTRGELPPAALLSRPVLDQWVVIRSEGRDLVEQHRKAEAVVLRCQREWRAPAGLKAIIGYEPAVGGWDAGFTTERDPTEFETCIAAELSAVIQTGAMAQIVVVAIVDDSRAASEEVAFWQGIDGDVPTVDR